MVKQGYLIWLDFDPQIGYEQKGRRIAARKTPADIIGEMVQKEIAAVL